VIKAAEETSVRGDENPKSPEKILRGKTSRYYRANAFTAHDKAGQPQRAASRALAEEMAHDSCSLV